MSCLCFSRCNALGLVQGKVEPAGHSRFVLFTAKYYTNSNQVNWDCGLGSSLLGLWLGAARWGLFGSCFVGACLLGKCLIVLLFGALLFIGGMLLWQALPASVGSSPDLSRVHSEVAPLWGAANPECMPAPLPSPGPNHVLLPILNACLSRSPFGTSSN